MSRPVLRRIDEDKDGLVALPPVNLVRSRLRKTVKEFAVSPPGRRAAALAAVWVAATGCDEDFGRGETPIQVTWGALDRAAPNPTMHPFRPEGPYHCIILGGGSLDTKGGPRINARAQVLDLAGIPIPGLYGAGNCIASPAGQAYWAAGGTIGPALTFGFVAGRNAAREHEK